MTAWYRAGTVEATNGSTTVTGTSTAWLMNAKVGDLWAPDADGRGYEITAVTSNTEIEIFPAYAGSTGSGKDYGIARISPNWNSVSELSVSLADILASQQNILSGDGAPSNDFGQDGDVYFRQDEAEYYAKDSGTWTLVTSLVGPAGPGGPSYQATSTTSNAIGTGSKTFTVEADRGYNVNQYLRATFDGSNYMEGRVSSYSSTTLILNVTRVVGSGTYTAWDINITGDVGPANSLEIGSVTTGAAGSNASASITGSPPSQTLNLTIPRGNTGVQGIQGPAGTITIGTVDTVEPDDPATVTNIGTSQAAILDFEIPKGDQGDPGTPLNPTGDYNGGTTYELNDVALVLGSSWVYINETPGSGNAPPTLPTTSNAHWQLLAQAGSNGTGAVDLVNGQSGIVVLDGTDIEAAYSPSNYSPAGDGIADHFQGVDEALANISSWGEAPDAIVASAATADIGAADGFYIEITGTTTITSLGTTPNVWRIVRFAGALTLTYNATTLILPGLASITTAAGDTAIFISDGDGNWRCTQYQRASQRVDGSTVTPERYGAVGDGTTDDTTAFQTALNNLNGRALVLDGSKTYKISSAALQMPSNTTILFNGATLDFSALTATNSDLGTIKLCLYAKGTGIVASSALTGNATEGAFTVGVASGATFAAGDWVQLTAEDAYTYDGATSVKRGEILQVQAVVSNDVTFRTPILDSYTTANTATLRKISFAENIHLDRPKLIGSNTEGHNMEGIRMFWVRNFTIRDCHVRDIDLRAVHVVNSILGDIDGGYIDGVRYTGSGTLFYAVTLNNCAQWISVRGVKAQEVRHLYVNSASTALYGQPYFVTVSDCHAFNMMAGGSLASYAFEHHGFGRFILINNCTGNGFHSGARIEGSDTMVSNCVFRNCRSYGVSIDDGRAIKNVQISNVRVSFQTSELTTARAGLAFYPGGNANANLENLVVDGLYVDGFIDAVNGSAFGVRAWSFQSAKNVVLRNVTVHAASDASNTDYGFYLETSNFQIINPRVHNYRRAFRTISTANDILIDNPVVTNDAVTGTAPAFQIGGDNHVIRSPYFNTVYRGFIIDAGADTTIVSHKVSKGVLNADTDGGTGTTITVSPTT